MPGWTRKKNQANFAKLYLIGPIELQTEATHNLIGQMTDSYSIPTLLWAKHL